MRGMVQEIGLFAAKAVIVLVTMLLLFATITPGEDNTKTAYLEYDEDASREWAVFGKIIEKALHNMKHEGAPEVLRDMYVDKKALQTYVTSAKLCGDRAPDVCTENYIAGGVNLLWKYRETGLDKEINWDALHMVYTICTDNEVKTNKALECATILADSKGNVLTITHLAGKMETEGNDFEYMVFPDAQNSKLTYIRASNLDTIGAMLKNLLK